MHPKEFKGFMEHIGELYSGMYEELQKLRRENKGLHEEMTKRRHVAPTVLGRVDGFVQLPKKVLKMGSDWHIEGDFHLPISLMRKWRFNSPICNVKISAGGTVAFTCNKRVFLWENEHFYVVEDQVKAFDPWQMKNDLTENFRCIFEFDGEAIIVFQRNSMVKFLDHKKIWSVPVSNVYHIAVSDGCIYVGTREYKILVFKENGMEADCVKMYEYKDAIKYFTITDGNVVGFSDTKVGIVNKGFFMNEGSRIMAMDADKGVAYFGGESFVLKVCKIGQTLEVADTLALKKPIFSVRVWGPYLLVACQDKTLSVWNLQQKACMRIVGNDSVVDIAANENTICCVDNNGSLRIWQIREVA